MDIDYKLLVTELQERIKNLNKELEYYKSKDSNTQMTERSENVTLKNNKLLHIVDPETGEVLREEWKISNKQVRFMLFHRYKYRLSDSEVSFLNNIKYQKTISLKQRTVYLRIVNKCQVRRTTGV